jgi:hypothetical protein
MDTGNRGDRLRGSAGDQPGGRWDVVSIESEAEELVRSHGEGARQLLVNRTVLAVKAGDEAEIARLDGILKAVERLIHTSRKTD